MTIFVRRIEDERNAIEKRKEIRFLYLGRLVHEDVLLRNHILPFLYRVKKREGAVY